LLSRGRLRTTRSPQAPPGFLVAKPGSTPKELELGMSAFAYHRPASRMSVFAVLALAGAALVSGPMWASPAHADGPARQPAVISLGAIIAAGQGGRLAGDPLDFITDEGYADRGIATYGQTWDFTDSTGSHPDGCHRSNSAPIFGIAGNMAHINIACSGA